MIFFAMQNTQSGSNNWMIYGLFLIAGLFIGGAWSAYKSKNIVLMVLAIAIAVAAAGGGIMWLLGELA